MKYIIYKSSGDIVNQVECPEGEIENYISEGCSFMEYAGSAIYKKVSGGDVVDKEIEPIMGVTSLSPSLTVRQQRDTLLAGSDWTQLPDSPLTDSKKAEWVTYRTTLRDIPETYTDVTTLDEVVWPTPPTGAL